MQFSFHAMQYFCNFLVFFGLIVAAIGGLGSFHYGKLNEKPHLDLDQIGATVRGEMDRLEAKLDAAPHSEDSNYPGFSLHSVLRLYDLGRPTRQYIYEFEVGRESYVSLYIDPNRSLTFSLRDRTGESATIRVDQKLAGPYFGEFVLISCDFGRTEASAFLRLWVNETLVQQIELPARIDVADIKVEKGVVGANLKGELNAKFEMVHFLVYGETLTAENRQKILEYHSSGHEKYIYFDGTKWMKHAEGIGLTQENQKYQPIYRDLANPKKS